MARERMHAAISTRFHWRFSQSVSRVRAILVIQHAAVSSGLGMCAIPARSLFFIIPVNSDHKKWSVIIPTRLMRAGPSVIMQRESEICERALCARYKRQAASWFAFLSRPDGVMHSSSERTELCVAEKKKPEQSSSKQPAAIIKQSCWMLSRKVDQMSRGEQTTIACHEPTCCCRSQLSSACTASNTSL